MGNDAGQFLELESVSRSADDERILAATDLRLERGSFTTILGRTGAGKTTLLRLMAGLDQPSTGIVRWNGKDVTGVSARRRDVAMVYQQFINYPSLTVFENIAAPLRNRERLQEGALRARVEEVASLLRIDHLLGRLPGELSGGQQQRTALARALVRKAGLVLLDEPLANLDYKLREELRNELRALLHSSNAIVVYATAEPAEALILGGQVVVLDAGRILQQGRPREVYEAPAVARVGQIFSEPEMNLWDMQISSDGHFSCGWGSYPLPAAFRHLTSGNYQLGVRPHHLRDRHCVTEPPAGALRIEGQVLLQEFTGAETVLHVRCGMRTATCLLDGARPYKLGSAVTLHVDLAHCFLFTAEGTLIPRTGDRPSAAQPPAEKPLTGVSYGTD